MRKHIGAGLHISPVPVGLEAPQYAVLLEVKAGLNATRERVISGCEPGRSRAVPEAIKIVLIRVQRCPANVATNVEAAEVSAPRYGENPARPLVPVSRGIAIRERRGCYRQ